MSRSGEPTIWHDRHGRRADEFARVRLAAPTGGEVVISPRHREEVIVPTGTLGTVLYVNEDLKLVGVEFDSEGSPFGNVAWAHAEIVTEEDA